MVERDWVSRSHDGDAWNDIASIEGWAVWQPEPTTSGLTASAYLICLECAEVYATTGKIPSSHSKRQSG